ncbi:MAG: hypothetical protein WC319_06605 [Candidatus Paceibacterota bacterium]|jgi:hypothetical protein
MSTIQDNLETDVYAKFKDWLDESWQKPIGFFVLGLVIWIIIFTFVKENSFVNQFFVLFINYINTLLGIQFFEYIFYLLTLIVIYIFIFKKVEYPVTPKNKIGIYLALLNNYKDKESNAFLNKIEIEIKDILEGTKTENIFNVVMLDRYKTLKIIKGGLSFYFPNIKRPKFQINLDKTRWTFLMYGKVKYAQGYKLEVDYILKHFKSIDLISSLKMGRDWKNFLKIQKWEFDGSEERKAIEITSENIKEHIYYSLGESLYASGLIENAYAFHDELYNLIQSKKDNFPHIDWLNKKLEKRLSDECFIISNYYASKKELQLAISWQEKSVYFNHQNYYAHINLASNYYLNGDIKKAYKEIELAEKTPADASFKLSKAFLKIDVEKKYNEGANLYIETLRRGFLPEKIIEGTLLFLESSSQKEKPISLFLKGLINYFKKSETEGKEIIMDFVNKNKENTEYKDLLNIAQRYIK